MQEDGETTNHFPDGRETWGVNVTFDEDTIGRMKAGYVCVVCWEIHQEAFPEKCAMCKFPMKERQSEEFAKQFGGEEWIGPDLTIDEIRAEDEERRAFEGKSATSSIWVPK